MNDLEKRKWLYCHVTVGATAYTGDLSKPSWLSDFNDDDLGMLDELQEQYVKDLMLWLDKKKIVKSYFDGSSDHDQRLLGDLGIESNLKNGGSDFTWNVDNIDRILASNILNLYLLATDGTALVVYEDLENVFVYDPNNSMPVELRNPRFKRAVSTKEANYRPEEIDNAQASSPK